MNKHEKLRLKILSGQSDASIDFAELVNMLEHFGFTLRIKGSHHMFAHPKLGERLVIPRHGKHVDKPYVRDVRTMLNRHDV